ncbi:diguanylate cyclase domain-containing protein [Halomonadaceae bacterium KBTZ08]
MKAAATTHDVVVLDLPQDQTAGAVFDLRRTREYQFALIFFRSKASYTDVPLSDGPLPETDDLVARWHSLEERMQLLHSNQIPSRFQERVLAWLWSRPDSALEPVRDTHLAQFYYYPLIRAMADDDSIDDGLWLQLMVDQGWLEPQQLYDRIRLCTHCDSARLNYVDVCPDCNALEISRQPALHCFTCGHVAPQEHFLKEGVMICPNCLTRLRHIGSDYDRPLENYRCRACESFFVDAEVEARCLDCNSRHSPDALRIREFRHYKLTESGRLRCRLGFSETLGQEQFGRLNLVGEQSFRNLLDWQIQQSRRYGDAAQGALLLMHFVNLNEVLSQNTGLAMLDNLVERIQESIRDTDRSTRTREEFLWLLLPQTDHNGMQQLWQRLSKLPQLFPDQEGVKLDVRFAGFALPDDLLSGEDGALVMARLTGEIR